MNSYLIASIIQYALMLLTYLLLPFYIKNSGKFIMGNFPKKFRPIYYTGIMVTLVSLGYLIYYCADKEISDNVDITNKVLLSLFIFFSSLWPILMIFYSKYKRNWLYYLIKINLVLTAGCALGLVINIGLEKYWDIFEKIAFAAAFLITAQSVIGDTIIWSYYFPKI